MLLANQGSNMKNTALKATVVALLLAPLMSFAAADTQSFSDTASMNVVVDGVGSQGFTMSWTDLVASWSKSASATYQATNLSWSLLGTNRKGTFTDTVAGPDSGLITINETGLASGNYSLKVSGTWTVGEHTWTVSTPVDVSIAAAPVSPVPEPESYAMLLAGLGLMGTIAVRRKSNQA